MRSVQSIVRKTVILQLFLFVNAALFMSCSKDNDNNKNSMYTVTGNASGSQVVPAVTGNGSGTFTGTYDANSRVMNYNSTWTGLSGNANTGGFYSGAAGSNSTMPAMYNFTLTPGTAMGAGTAMGTMTLTQAQHDDLMAGRWYYTVGTEANPNGEVRGQISANR
jgi:hypothetical protein